MQTFALLCCVFVGSVSTAWNYMWVGTLPAGGLPCGSDCSYGRLVANWWLYIGGARNCYQCQCWLHMFLIRALCNPHGQLSWLLLGSEFWCSYPNDHRWRWMSRKRTMIITTMIGQVCVWAWENVMYRLKELHLGERRGGSTTLNTIILYGLLYHAHMPHHFMYQLYHVPVWLANTVYYTMTGCSAGIVF